MSAGAAEPHVGLVVEGAGDLNSLPILLRKHLASRQEFRDILGKPVPLHGRDKAFVKNGIEGYVAVSAARPGCVGVLVVLDAESDCIKARGQDLATRSRKVSRVPVEVVLIDKYFEDWIYASAETLELGFDAYIAEKHGMYKIKEALQPDAYTKPVWQPRLTSRIDLDLAGSRSETLRRCLDRFDRLRVAMPPSSV